MHCIEVQALANSVQEVLGRRLHSNSYSECDSIWVISCTLYVHYMYIICITLFLLLKTPFFTLP